jgi:drug/metabolite transporter (DMT)-like permease
MSNDETPKVLRLRKKHAPGDHAPPTAADGARLVAGQSVRHALMAGTATILVFALLWTLVSDLTNRVLPYLSLALGVLVGITVRRAGQGFDWRFPTIAAVLVLVGALVGNIVIAATETSREFDTNIFVILNSVTVYTWPVFFGEVMNWADVVYALFGAAIGAFFSTRRLDRREFQALRIYRDTKRSASDEA